METTTPSDLIFDASTANFQQLVVDRSHELPVLVDFWAPWCGPCRTLGPALEQAVQGLGGKLLLAKVNTDSEQELAQRFRISGIPAVKAFHKGRVVNEFVGARDAKFIAGFLAALVPARGEQELLAAVKHLLQQQYGAAEALLRPLATGDQPLDGARLCRALLMLAESLLGKGPEHYAEVAKLLAKIDPRSADIERAELVQKVLAFYQAGDQDGGAASASERLQKNDRDSAARYIQAASQARQGQLTEALANLLMLIERDRHYGDDAAKRATLALFEYFGQPASPQADVIHEYRRRLQLLL